MSVKLSFHPAAENEILTAQGWYADRSLIAASAFLHEVDLVVARALEAPERWPEYSPGTRRIVFPRFPFSLIYRVKLDVVQVIAVAHHSRKPGYWKSRTI